MQGADAVIITTGYKGSILQPAGFKEVDQIGGYFRMARAVSHIRLLRVMIGDHPAGRCAGRCAGTTNAIDAARKQGVKKLVLMTSILTNGRAVGQGLNPGFVFLNLFGGVLDAKLAVRRK